MGLQKYIAYLRDIAVKLKTYLRFAKLEVVCWVSSLLNIKIFRYLTNYVYFNNLSK